MGGCGSTSDNKALEADLARIAQEEREQARRAALPPIGLVVQRDGGQADARVEVRPWEPVHGSLGRALGLDTRHEVTEAWLGQLQLDGGGSWEGQHDYVPQTRKAKNEMFSPLTT